MKKSDVFYDILLIFLGICIGACIVYSQYPVQAYPGPGDWNGDGILTIADIAAAIKEIIHGPVYPEYVVG